MALSESLKAQAIRELGETICPVCGSTKKRGHCFCGKCFFSLPARTRARLYATLSEGFASNYDDAKSELNSHGPS